MEAGLVRRRWRLEPAPVYAGVWYRRIVVGLFFLNAALYVAVCGWS